MPTINGIKTLRIVMKVEKPLLVKQIVLIPHQFLKLELPIIIVVFGMNVTINYMSRGKKPKQLH